MRASRGAAHDAVSSWARLIAAGSSLGDSTSTSWRRCLRNQGSFWAVEARRSAGSIGMLLINIDLIGFMGRRSGESVAFLPHEI